MTRKTESPAQPAKRPPSSTFKAPPPADDEAKKKAAEKLAADLPNAETVEESDDLFGNHR